MTDTVFELRRYTLKPGAREAIASVYLPLQDITAMNAAVKDGQTMDQAVSNWLDAHADLLSRWENIKSHD